MRIGLSKRHAGISPAADAQTVLSSEVATPMLGATEARTRAWLAVASGPTIQQIDYIPPKHSPSVSLPQEAQLP